MGYAERVADNLKGCEAISTGLCPGCDTCRKEFDAYTVRETTEDESGVFTRWTFDANKGEAGPQGNYLDPQDPRRTIHFATEAEAEAAAREAFREAWSNGDVYSEGSFSWAGCGICGSTLGGTLESWHYVANNAEGVRTIYHHSDACVDCVAYLNNGTLPDEDEEPAEDEPEEPTDSDECTYMVDKADPTNCACPFGEHYDNCPNKA